MTCSWKESHSSLAHIEDDGFEHWHILKLDLMLTLTDVTPKSDR